MVYYGWVKTGVEVDQVYQVLRGALREMPKEYPYRGPQKHEEEGFVYINKWMGEVDRFSGEERIMQGERQVYQANYMGGWIDKRQGV